MPLDADERKGFVGQRFHALIFRTPLDCLQPVTQQLYGLVMGAVYNGLFPVEFMEP
jgi:hypothetical protein